MSFYNTGNSSKGSSMPSLCVAQKICPCFPERPPVCPPGPPAPPVLAIPTATIPFSVSQNGIQLSTDAQGNPQIVYFSGFGPAELGYPLFFREGEWATGTITLGPGSSYGTAFIMPYEATLKNIYVLFSSKFGLALEPGSTIYPFACLAVSNSANLVYTILQDTIAYTEPYIGGFEYPKHTLRRGSLTNLNISIPEGTLVAIVTGIRGVNVTEEQYGQFTISGGLFLE